MLNAFHFSFISVFLRRSIGIIPNGHLLFKSTSPPGTILRREAFCVISTLRENKGSHAIRSAVHGFPSYRLVR